MYKDITTSSLFCHLVPYNCVIAFPNRKMITAASNQNPPNYHVTHVSQAISELNHLSPSNRHVCHSECCLVGNTIIVYKRTATHRFTRTPMAHTQMWDTPYGSQPASQLEESARNYSRLQLFMTAGALLSALSIYTHTEICAFINRVGCSSPPHIGGAE